MLGGALWRLGALVRAAALALRAGRDADAGVLGSLNGPYCFVIEACAEADPAAVDLAA